MINLEVGDVIEMIGNVGKRGDLYTAYKKETLDGTCNVHLRHNKGTDIDMMLWGKKDEGGLGNEVFFHEQYKIVGHIEQIEEEVI